MYVYMYVCILTLTIAISLDFRRFRKLSSSLDTRINRFAIAFFNTDSHIGFRKESSTPFSTLFSFYFYPFELKKFFNLSFIVQMVRSSFFGCTGTTVLVFLVICFEHFSQILYQS